MKDEQQPLTPEDMAHCAEEPIHIPGAIQPHGILLACQGPELRLLQVSANLGEFVPAKIEELLGQPIALLLGENQSAKLQALLQTQAFPAANPLHVELGERAFDGIAHDSEGVTVLELEPCSADQPAAATDLLQAVGRLRTSGNLNELHRIAVEAVRELTDFDRVMLYQFDDDGHGEVVAEAKAHDLEPYLGLHYPAADIPAQARELYRRNWLRIIPDAAYTPVPLIPAQRPDTRRPLDMSCSVLRSVSPVHREYMANAGFRASMSVSLLRGDKLWGLIACVHGSPRRVPYVTRQACETIGQLMSLQTSALLELEERAARQQKQAVLERLQRALTSSEEEIPAALLREPVALLELTGARGAALVIDGHIDTAGTCPPEHELDGIVELALGQQREGLFRTEQLPLLHPPAARYADVAAGVLAVVIPKPGRNGVVWLLPEQQTLVNWAGKPVKKVEPTADGIRLHPRRSFALWQDQVRGRSRRWHPVEIWAATELRRLAMELDLGRQVKRERVAVQAREELLGVVSHDLRTPLSVTLIQTALIKRMLASEASNRDRLWHALERIEAAGNRMRSLIEDLLLANRFETGSFALEARPMKAREAMNETLQLLRPIAEAKGVALLDNQHSETVINADPDRLFQILLNLVSNAIRFTPEGGRVTLTTDDLADSVEFSVQDTGPGIPASEQQRIFERFHGSGVAGGLGLGLYIARNIVKAHGGEIEVESEPGTGSTFRFRIPRGEPHPR
ncbi:hypothetical protein CAI21_15015 [Alkalilimnicola ehrlichii]|uniref:histidine kinase n=1 Tax=Alkalilimnicola ehrlichii TaxID=351052 RepID=A0A3E0WQH3_9GAMM|nr:ATP-binding protein [Alkalilimnicola ehrlichii]RFA27338.1 hypothetical protein CAI21_15015 [Alkalilimnicola ehrlichii]RFA34443.1 hypothetical protein CAL65_15585 [Alkalilimnicola ehrlichii]